MEFEAQSHLLQFAEFEIDLRTRELRREQQLIRMQDLPVRLLILLATRAGELVTREEIEQELWGDDHFVDFDHGINTAMRKVREALGESTESPRFIETLPRKGYRFIALVQRGSTAAVPAVSPILSPQAVSDAVENPLPPPLAGAIPDDTPAAEPTTSSATNALAQEALADEDENFALPSEPSRRLFLVTQAGYLIMYCVALFKLEAAGRVMDQFFSIRPEASLPLLIAISLCGIAVRLFLITSVGFRHPNAGIKYRKLFPAVFILDMLWAASPLLLVEKVGVLSLAGIAGLAYLPFSQRILMNSIYPGR